MSNPQPPWNFLFLMTDQHRPDHTGFGGNPIVRTPHLDALAARAVRFDRAYVANPICMPNRATILTGRQPSVHGTRYNGVSLDWDAQTFVRVLREAGYRTGLVGKAHFQNMGHGPADFVASLFPAKRDARRATWPAGWDDFERMDLHRQRHVDMPEDFYGFEHVELVVNHSDVCSGHYVQWLRAQGADPDALQGREHALRAYDGWGQVYQTALPEELYPTSYVSGRAEAFLERTAADGRPFFLQCSYPDPHHPFTPPGRFYDMYDPASLPLPPTFDDAHERSMPHLKRMAAHRGRQGVPIQPFAPTAEQLREATAKEYGMISMIDEGIGRVLATLERLDLARRTVVVFTSDHGDMFGDHGLLLKAGMHYEGCIRVPLLIAAPGRHAAVCRSLVGSLDLAQTMLDLAGQPAFHGMQGRSLLPLLEDPQARVRDQVVVEEDEMFDLLGVGGPLRMRTLVTEDARLTLYQGTQDGELFDLARDPDERDNLYAASAARDQRAALTEQLARRLMDYADEAPKPNFVA